MKKEELRKEYVRLSRLETMKDNIDLLNIFLEHFWNVIRKHHEDKVYSYANKDAKIINQMMFTKLTHLKKLVEGVGYIANDGSKLNPIVDPTIIASLTRNIYETVAVFNLIFRNAKTDDEKAIIYGLWVSSGLKYRQRFEPIATIPENKQKIEDEKKQIEQIEKEIRETDLYKSLSEKNQGKIEEKLKQKDFKIRFDKTEVIFLTWQDMCEVMGLSTDLFDNIYTYFSFYTHPSQVSVFQFENMYSKVDEAFKRLTKTNLKYCFSFMSFFIADYINLFPQVRQTFEELEIEKQIALNEHNILLRSKDYSINNSWKELE